MFADGNTPAPTDSTLALWTSTNGGLNTWNGLAPTGNFVAMDADYGTGPISQTVNGLTAGDTYTLTFDYAFGQQTYYYGPTTQMLTASATNSITSAVDGTWTSATVNLPSQGFSGWSSESLTFTASGASDVASFLAAGSPQVPPFTLVSDVSLTGVPEPATWAMLLAASPASASRASAPTAARPSPIADEAPEPQRSGRRSGRPDSFRPSTASR